MPIPDSYQSIIKDLLRRSKAGEAEWKRRTAGTFTLEFSRFSFQIWEWHHDFSETDGVSCALINSSGESIDTFSIGDGDSDYPIVKDLFDQARRKGNGVENLLDEFRKQLSEGGKVGEEDLPF